VAGKTLAVGGNLIFRPEPWTPSLDLAPANYDLYRKLIPHYSLLLSESEMASDLLNLDFWGDF
jgi:hypothetical protein